MQITVLNSRHNSENFDISFAYQRIFFTKFCGPKNSPAFLDHPVFVCYNSLANKRIHKVCNTVYLSSCYIC